MRNFSSPWLLLVLPAAALAGLVLLSCGGGAGPDDTNAVVPAGPFSYDGSFHSSIGAFPITDMRSKMVEADGDSLDLYAEMESYETRNLTVYHRASSAGEPVVLFIHGGAWTDGYMEWYDFVAESFTSSEGYVTVVVNYRLTSESVFPAAICPTRSSEAPDPSLKAAWYPDNIRDCADALQWTVDHVAEYGGDPGSIFVFGHSAGGHLASLLAAHEDYAALRPRIRGLVSMSGVYTLDDVSALVLADAFDQTFGTDADEAVLDEASPSWSVVAGMDLPPFLVLYCEEDLPTFAAEALAFSSKLSSLGFEVETAYLPGYDHVSEMEAIENPEAAPTARILDFIEDRLD
ncbi:MAG: alpha/beta hydrolase [Candidatus Eisenbacteria bacterium]